MEYLGWIGAILLAVCSAPQALKSFRDKHSNGLTWPFLLMWFFGSVLLGAYQVYKGDIPTIFNLSLNSLLVGVMIFYKIVGKIQIR